VLVDTAQAHSGSKSVHLHASSVNTGVRAYLLTQGASTFPVAGKQVSVL
jgi:hypothetical protein